MSSHGVSSVLSTKPKLQVHTLELSKSDTHPKDRDLEPILAIHRQIFNISPNDENSHYSLTAWQGRLAGPDGILIYTTTSEALSSSAKTIAPSPQGYILAYRRYYDEIGHDALHIWLAGVLRETRGAGHFPAMLKELEKFAATRELQTLSVCTFPARFEKMYEILVKTGWQVKAEIGGGKLLLARDII